MSAGVTVSTADCIERRKGAEQEGAVTHFFSSIARVYWSDRAVYFSSGRPSTLLLRSFTRAYYVLTVPIAILFLPSRLESTQLIV